MLLVAVADADAAAAVATAAAAAAAATVVSNSALFSHWSAVADVVRVTSTPSALALCIQFAYTLAFTHSFTAIFVSFVRRARGLFLVTQWVYPIGPLRQVHFPIQKPSEPLQMKNKQTKKKQKNKYNENTAKGIGHRQEDSHIWRTRTKRKMSRWRHLTVSGPRS